MANVKYRFPYSRSGPIFEAYEVDENWFKQFIACVDACTLDGPARDALIAHVMEAVAKPTGRCVGVAEFDYTPERPAPLGYISKSGIHMLSTARKAFVTPDKDALYVWPVYIGNKLT